MGEKWRRKKAEIAIILAAAFCVVVACVSIYTVNSIARQRLPQIEPASGLTAEANVKIGTLNNMEGRQEEPDEIAKGGLITFPINATPSLQTGDGEASLLTKNPPDNGTRLTVTITCDDTGEKTHQSGYLDLERYIDKTLLDVVLPKGEYPCTASPNSYRIKGSSHLGRAAVKVTIYVLN